MHLSALVHEFLLDCRVRRLSPKTVSWYQANLRYFLEWLAEQGLGDDLAVFTPDTGRRYSHALSERTVKKACPGR